MSCGILFPVLQKVVAGHIPLVADADEGRNPQLQPLRGSKNGQSQRTTLR